MIYYQTQTERMTEILAANAPMPIESIVAEEIKEFKSSPQYVTMLEADRYYRNRSSVQDKKNDIAERSNTKIEHSILRKLISQKVNYLLAKPFTINSDSDQYAEALNKDVFDDVHRVKVQGLARNAIRYGIGYLQPYYNAKGRLTFMRLSSLEVIPLWADSEHSELAGFIRFYPEVVYAARDKKTITRAELWTPEGVQYFVSDDSTGVGKYEIDTSKGAEGKANHFKVGNQAKNWVVPPLIWAKYNDEELPLCYWIKELIDDINWQTSVTSDVLRDIAKFIYVLRNYGGANLAEFVRDLKKTLAIKVDKDGGVDKLQADINIDAVMKLLDKQRRDIYDYGNGVDTKDPDLGDASGTALNFRYTDLDGDCEALGTEIKGAIQRGRVFMDGYLQVLGKGDFTSASLDLVFSTDMPVNETDVIGNVSASTDLSKRTRIENHPWVTDVDAELDRIKKEQDEADKRMRDQVGTLYPVPNKTTPQPGDKGGAV